MISDIREFQAGLFSLRLGPCTTAVLAHVIDPTIPTVWVAGHRPGAHVHWCPTSIALSETSAIRHLLVRDVVFDFQMPTLDFLQIEPELRHAGITLIQLNGPVPDTLTARGLKGEARYKVLAANGFFLEFELAHAGEHGTIVSPVRSSLERLVRMPEMATYLD